MSNEDDLRETSNKSNDQRLEALRQRNVIDAKFGYQPYTETAARDAWLVNVQHCEVFDEPTKTILAAIDLYFLEEDGSRFKVPYQFRPYLYLEASKGNEFIVSTYLSRKYHWIKIDHVEKENLELKNHLSGIRSKYLRVSFPSTAELAKFKRELMPQIKKNRQALDQASDYTAMLTEYMGGGKMPPHLEDGPLEQILDIREHDLPFDMRVCIDEKFFVGHWYSVIGRVPSTQRPAIRRNETIVEPPDPVICAFDIETTKAPLKFPDSSFDRIMMISYMVDGAGFLIVNREIVAADIDDLEYTPRPEFRGEFRVFNEPDEKATLMRFFDHLLRVRPHIMVTYNGDSFDWPFVDARATVHGISLSTYLGFFKDSQDEYKHNNCIHMDAYRWVQRDSYLPMGSQSLKAATREKLRYDPVEIDPEDMVPMAYERPNTLASYSVSDAVATYYLYNKYVHPFIFALCTIIPLAPDDVLRKGSGTLCEALLMVQAFHNNIIFPNKQIQRAERMTEDGHLILSDTYVGGHVEALESGVFRADIPCRFKLDVDALEQLKEYVRPTIEHALRNDAKVTDLEAEVPDFDEVCAQIEAALEVLIEHPVRTECPKIYHLDVGAMYPNIILTNRLQPPAVVNEEMCMACVHNAPDAKCKRPMEWKWRGDIIPASRGEYARMMQQLENEKFGKDRRPYSKLPREEQEKIAKDRIKEFCRNAYKKAHETRDEKRTTVICQREHPFYVDTVRAFRDRRYEYKEMHKKAKAAVEAVPADDLAERKLAQARVVLYDSLQLAHKCILNSFYGYVMRKGSRWFSMEMAGIVCYTGANIITEARELIERVGRPLELDTDGIWCLLPKAFPENYVFHTASGKPIKVSYPGALLNALVKDRFTNEQYHTVDLQTGRCEISSENSIFFEVDGPYHAMILPASKEEGKKLKKRYAVFNFDGTLAELKGFEVKRRGELAIIKHFQTEVFKCFLKGSSLAEIYANVAKEANYWLDILQDKGETLSRRELFDLIGESKSMSRTLEDYGEQKSTSIGTAKRLAEFLGADMVRNKGLACNFIVSRFPLGDPVSERTIPLAIFDAPPKERIKFLRRWTKGASLSEEFGSDRCLKELIDWQYYTERLGSCIQKIITIPAALQGIPNPVPRVKHPQWLENKRRERVELHTQPRISDMFKRVGDPRTPSLFGSAGKARSGVGLTPWYLKRNRQQMAHADETTPVGSRKRPLLERVAERDGVENGEVLKRICVTTDSMDKENNAKQIDEPELITLDALEETETVPPTEPTVNGEEAAPNVPNASVHPKTAAGVLKRTKAQLQREAKRRALAQHASRRFPRDIYNMLCENDATEKKTWRNNGFKEWLSFFKSKWRRQRQARNTAFNAAVFTEDGNVDNASNNNSIVQAALASARRESTWHILQVRESKVPGQFTVFALVDGSMRRFNLDVQRTIYVDDNEPRWTATGRLTQKILPRPRPSAYLYEFPIDERAFAARMTDLITELCLMRINGIYETKCPLMFKTLVHTGVLCHATTAGGHGEMSLEAITRHDPPLDGAKPGSAHSRLDLDRVRPLFLYEYHHGGRSSSRSVLSLFNPSAGHAHVFVLNRQPLDLRNLDALYASELQKYVRQRCGDSVDSSSGRNDPSFPGWTHCQGIKKVEPVQCSSKEKAAQKLRAQISALKWAPIEPVLLCILSNRPNEQLYKDFPSLREFPSFRIRNVEPPDLSSVLDWANMLARLSIQHFFNSFTYLKECWSLSMYMELPIGNLPDDLPKLAIDALYARQLQSKNHLLWASPSVQPDFGGKDLEDLRLENDWESVSFTEARPYVLNKETFEANSICAELTLGAVAVTALLQSARIADAEGTSEQTGFAASASAQPTTLSIADAFSHRHGLNKYDDSALVGGALRCLRDVFHRLVKDIHHYGSVFADQLVVNMHSDPNSLLFHPAIRTTLITLMRKLCLLLAAEIQRLGGTVLHCSFNRLVLCTNKGTLPLAKAFLDSLLLSLAQKTMFSSLQLDIRLCSNVLLWIDQANFALIYASDDAKNGRAEMRFALADRIPEERGCRGAFKKMVAGFMGMMAERKRELSEQTQEEFDAFCVEKLTEVLMPDLFALTTKLVTLRPQLRPLAAEYDCEDVPLEFVNCISRVLSVLPCLDDHVDGMRNQLFLILQQDGTSLDRERSLADWTPSNGVILEHVFCPHCFESADLDIDQHHRQQRDAAAVVHSENVSAPFTCPYCDTAYPTTLVEEMLIERVTRMHTAFVLQDWLCTACKKMGANYLSRHCDCNNPLKGTVSSEQLRANLHLVRRLAKRHALSDLEHTLEHILNGY